MPAGSHGRNEPGRSRWPARLRHAGVYFGIIADGRETQAALADRAEPRFTGWRAPVSEAAFGVAWTSAALILQPLGVAIVIAVTWTVAVLARSRVGASVRRRFTEATDQMTFVANVASSVISFSDVSLSRILVAVLVGAVFLLAAARILDRFEPSRDAMRPRT